LGFFLKYNKYNWPTAHLYTKYSGITHGEAKDAVLASVEMQSGFVDYMA
jgi:hypothetical protein